MKTVVQVEGLRALDEALGQLPKSIGRAVLRRTLVMAGEPIAEAARSMAPTRPSGGQLRDSIAVSTKVKNPVGKAEYGRALAQGLGVGAARQALRDARRAAAGEGAFVEMYVGPSTSGWYAHFVEFGTAKAAPQPFMRPAWDSNKDRALDIIKRELGGQIIAAAKRVGRSKRYSADIKYQASIAALMAVEAGG
jgi:HK97 gp10 family phage protein